MPYSEYNEKMCPEKKDTSRDFARLMCKLNPLRKRIRAQRCYRHFRCVSKRKADDFNVSLLKSVVAQALQIPLKHLSSNRLEFQSLTSQSGCSFDMFKNLRREDIMKHPWIRVQDEDGSKPSFYTLAPTEEAFMSLLPASWVAILGTPKVEFFWVIKLKFGSGWARKRPVNPHVFSCEVCETGGFIETDERTILHVAAEKNFGKAMMEARECWVEWQGRIAFHSLVQNSWSCHIKAWPTKLAFKHSLSIHWSRHWN